MKTVQDYIGIIRQNSSKITHDFGIKSLRIFGSVSRNEQTESSDVEYVWYTGNNPQWGVPLFQIISFVH